MKKIVLMAVVLLSSVATFAQQPAGTFSIQPKVGMNIANVTGDDVSDNDARIGVAAGAEFMYQATDMVGISFGALYSMQGYKDDNYTRKLDYINVPILANVYVAKGLAVKLGIQPGFNVNSEWKVSKSNGADTYKEDAKSVELSIPVGISYEYDGFVIDGRYNWGVTNVVKNWEAKNSVFQITLGYKFAL